MARAAALLVLAACSCLGEAALRRRAEHQQQLQATPACVHVPELEITVTPDALRMATLATAATIYNDFEYYWQPKPNSKKPSSVTKCTGTSAVDDITWDMQGSAFYGSVASPLQFLVLALGANSQCSGGGVYSHHFFTIGDLVFYRYCGGGAGTGYIHFFGTTDGKASACFDGDYPTMYSRAVTRPGPGRPVLDAIAPRAVLAIAKAGVASTDAQSIGLANILAAQLIAEAQRDHFLALGNYMLYALMAAGVYTPESVLGGRCPHTCGTTAPKCQNRAGSTGVHPMAFGGAQACMTLGAFPGAAGANSADGIALENEIATLWATLDEVFGEEATDCTGALNWAGVGTKQLQLQALIARDAAGITLDV